MERKYARIFVLRHCLVLKSHTFPRATLSKSCSLLGTENVRGQISEHISVPNGIVQYLSDWFTESRLPAFIPTSDDIWKWKRQMSLGINFFAGSFVDKNKYGWKKQIRCAISRRNTRNYGQSIPSNNKQKSTKFGMRLFNGKYSLSFP